MTYEVIERRKARNSTSCSMRKRLSAACTSRGHEGFTDLLIETRSQANGKVGFVHDRCLSHRLKTLANACVVHAHAQGVLPKRADAEDTAR
jgi:hypothetical protein